jgi:hypothetical protein
MTDLTWTTLDDSQPVFIYKGVFSSPVDSVSVLQSVPEWYYTTSLTAMTSTGQEIGQCIEQYGAAYPGLPGGTGCLVTVSLNGNGATYQMSFTAPDIGMLVETNYDGGPIGAVSYTAMPAPSIAIGVDEPSPLALFGVAVGVPVLLGVIVLAIRVFRK